MRSLWVAGLVVTSGMIAANDEPATGSAANIVSVQRERYQEHPAEATAINVQAYYVGPGLDREEIHSIERISDEPERPQRRRSEDNGRTWAAFEPVPDIVLREGDYKIFWGPGPMLYDAAAGLTVSIWLRQPYKGNVYYNQCFSRVSRDQGLTWSEPRQLRYEEGPEFSPETALTPEFLLRNQAYFGNNIIRHSNGTLIHCVASANVPYENKTGKSYHGWFPADAKNIGSLCFIGTWNPDAKECEWQAGAPVWVPFETSSRGLLEPDIVELKDTRLLVVWRGSDTPETAGRKWFSLSEDGGRTLTPVAEWQYDDGTRFYSPSSIHRFIRHSVTGTLYWLGNICPSPPRGNSPRYPLIIAEVDEARAALKRNTVTVVDDRGPEDGPDVQLSNFSLFEDRETHAFELYLTKFGQYPGSVYTADNYRYVLTLR